MVKLFSIFSRRTIIFSLPVRGYLSLSSQTNLQCYQPSPFPVSDSLQMKLGEFLPRVLDCSAETVVLKDPPKVHVNQAHDLCSRLAAVMESIHNTTVVAVK